MLQDSIGVGLTILGIGIPVAVSIVKFVPGKNGNGELARIMSAIARLEERSNQQHDQIARLTERVDTLVDRLKK